MVHLARKMLKNSIYNNSRVIISGVGGLIFTVVLARLLHPGLLGIYHLALAVAFLLLTFADLALEVFDFKKAVQVAWDLNQNNKYF